MSIIRKTFQVLVVVGFIIACGNSNKANNGQSSSDGKAQDEVALKDIGVRLDNGKLWSANVETTSGINNMIKIMEEFSNRESVVAYPDLNKKLQNEFGLIFQRCTMTGEAHNQLHNYLVPMKDMFEGLGSSDINTCQRNYNKMAKHLAAYSNYFE